MNVTFLIGNGFDLNLGLRTSYKDFYKYYIENTQPDMLSTSISENFELWADLETGLGKYLNIVKSNEVDDYLLCKGNLEYHLSQFLLKEQNKVIYPDNDILRKEFVDCISNFSNDFNNRDLSNWTKMVSNLPERINYKFITFNYTNVLDRIIATCYGKPFSQHRCANNTNPIADTISLPLHIHGYADKGMILGINDGSQINNDELRNNRALSNYIIKENVNEALGNMNTQRAQEMIDESRYVCVYGMSIGDTDSMWWSHLIKWLISNGNNRLILYVYDNTIVQASGQESVRNSDKIRTRIASHHNKLSENEIAGLRNRISIIYNSSIFNFENIKVQEEHNGQDEDAE